MNATGNTIKGWLLSPVNTMYDENIVCTYAQLGDSDPDQSDDLYRIQLLQAFGMDQYDDDAMGDAIVALHRRIRALAPSELARVLQVLGEADQFKGLSALAGGDEECLFSMLMGYATFAHAHKWFSCVLREDVGAKSALENLLEAL